MKTGCFLDFLTIARGELWPQRGRCQAAGGHYWGLSPWVMPIYRSEDSAPVGGIGVEYNECGPPQAGRTLVARW